MRTQFNLLTFNFIIRQASQAAAHKTPTSHQEDIPSDQKTANSSASKTTSPETSGKKIQEYELGKDQFDNSLSAASLCSAVPDFDDYMSEASQSIAGSASAQLKKDLDRKAELLREANKKAEAFRLRCEALESKLKESRKKRKSPDAPKASAKEPESLPRPPKKAKPFKDIIGAAEAPDNGDTDDEVPSPDEAKLSNSNKLYEGLNSILCAYKSGKVTPSTDGNITFKMVAELCEEDAINASKWSKHSIVQRHPMVLSALRLVYPNKKDSWFQKPFLKSAKGAHKYCLLEK